MIRTAAAMVGLLMGVPGALAQEAVAPQVDCTGDGVLLGAEAGWIAVDDEVLLVVEALEDGGAHGIPVRDFCAERDGLVGFILPVPKIYGGGEAPEGPDRPSPTGDDGPVVPLARGGGGVGFGLTPGGSKRPAGGEGDEPAPSPSAEKSEEISPEPGPLEPAPSPSADPEGEPPVGYAAPSGGCAATPDAPWSWSAALLLLLAVRRKGGGR